MVPYGRRFRQYRSPEGPRPFSGATLCRARLEQLFHENTEAQEEVAGLRADVSAGLTVDSDPARRDQFIAMPTRSDTRSGEEAIKAHGALLYHCHSERSRGIPRRDPEVNLRDPSTPFRSAQDDLEY